MISVQVVNGLEVVCAFRITMARKRNHKGVIAALIGRVSACLSKSKDFFKVFFRVDRYIQRCPLFCTRTLRSTLLRFRPRSESEGLQSEDADALDLFVVRSMSDAVRVTLLDGLVRRGCTIGYFDDGHIYPLVVVVVGPGTDDVAQIALSPSSPFSS